MTLVEFIKAELKRLHATLDAATAGLTPAQWHAIPGSSPRANHIAFEVWHFYRTEDNIVRFILQDRRPTVWMEGRWAERLGLPAVAQGTGMSPADAQALCITDFDALRGYIDAVRASSDEYLSAPDASTFDRLVMVKPLGEMPAVRALGQVVVTHGFTHLGEIDLIRTLQELPTSIGI
ncbi:MAG: DinB family protein [Dehalococcoidia bacterium]|nr:DinB family protein [Dehalococcoidia bacterium]